MRSSRRVGTALWAAVFSLALPLSQAQAADDCVKFQGLQHCGLGAAKVSGSEKGVRIDSEETSGKSGVAIYTPPAAAWTAETVSDGAQRNFFTAYAEEAPVSTATVSSTREGTTYSATFTGSGDATTYSVLAYHNGRLQAAVGGIRSGDTAVVTSPVLLPTPGWSPTCRPRAQTVAQCQTACQQNGYGNCNYCYTPCPLTGGFGGATFNSACFWQFAVAERAVRLPNGETVQADHIVMQEEVSGPSNYPYLNFNRIDMQTTARSTVITGESIVPASK